MSNHTPSRPSTSRHESKSDKKKSSRVEDVENKSLAQGNQVDDDAQLGADNDADMPGASQVESEANIETATLRDKEGRLVESDDTKRASGNRSTSQFRQSDQHGNMTRSDDRRHGKGGGPNSQFVKH